MQGSTRMQTFWVCSDTDSWFADFQARLCHRPLSRSHSAPSPLNPAEPFSQFRRAASFSTGAKLVPVRSGDDEEKTPAGKERLGY